MLNTQICEKWPKIALVICKEKPKHSQRQCRVEGKATKINTETPTRPPPIILTKNNDSSKQINGSC